MAIKTEVELDRFDLREILLRGSEVWNSWRREHRDLVINLSLADLRGAILIRADLFRANLSGANLSGADLSEANLSEANLSEAILIEADFSGADFRGANLRGADFRGADFRGANLSRANLSEAILSGADFRGADLFRANLSEANFIGANLSEAILSGAILSGAILIAANLSRTNLSEADFRGANLSRTNLSEADFSEAILSGTILRGADLSDVQGIDPKLFEDTFNIKIFDQDIDPSALEEINTAVSNYAEAAGYTDPEIISEKHGSFFRDIRYKVAKVLTPEVREEATRAGEDLYRRGKANVQARLEQPGVESTKQLAEATAQLLKSIENVDNAILTLGKVIVVKCTNQNGKSITIVRTVSTEIQHQLEAMPHLLNSPKALIKFLNAGKKEETKIEPAKVINQ